MTFSILRNVLFQKNVFQESQKKNSKKKRKEKVKIKNEGKNE